MNAIASSDAPHVRRSAATAAAACAPPLAYFLMSLIASNGMRPIRISKVSTPSAHQSDAVVRPRPRTSSGGTYASVPTAVKVRLCSIFLAKPRSARRT